MVKIVIKNRAEEKWHVVIAEKLQFILGSMLAYTTRIDVEFDKVSHIDGKWITYTCKLSLHDDNGDRHVLCNGQPDGDLAIEGAIARAKRVMVRRSRSRVSGRRPASTH